MIGRRVALGGLIDLSHHGAHPMGCRAAFLPIGTRMQEDDYQALAVILTGQDAACPGF